MKKKKKICRLMVKLRIFFVDLDSVKFIKYTMTNDWSRWGLGGGGNDCALIVD